MTLARTMIVSGIASGALLALSACGKSTEPYAANDTTPAGTTIADPGTANGLAPAAAPTVAASPAQSFANVAAASDAFEIQTSQVALANGASTAKLKTAAAAATPPVTPDPALNAEQQQKLDQLKALNGEAFDQAYAAEQAAAHQQALDALKAGAATLDVAALKTFATEQVPVVTAHLNMAKAMKP